MKQNSGGGTHWGRAVHCSAVMHNSSGNTLGHDASLRFAVGRRALDGSQHRPSARQCLRGNVSRGPGRGMGQGKRRCLCGDQPSLSSGRVLRGRVEGGA